MGQRLPTIDDMQPLPREEVVQAILEAFPEGTVLEYASGVRRMVTGTDPRNGELTLRTLCYPDGSMPKGQRTLTTSIRRILEEYGI